MPGFRDCPRTAANPPPSAYTLHSEDDDWSPAGTMVLDVHDEEQRAPLIANAAGHLKDGVSEPILARVFEYWQNIDKQICDKVEAAVHNGG